MIIFKKGIGKLHKLTHNEVQWLLKKLPKNWEYDCLCIYESNIDEEYNKYDVKLYRK